MCFDIVLFVLICHLFCPVFHLVKVALKYSRRFDRILIFREQYHLQKLLLLCFRTYVRYSINGFSKQLWYSSRYQKPASISQHNAFNLPMHSKETTKINVPSIEILVILPNLLNDLPNFKNTSHNVLHIILFIGLPVSARPTFLDN